MAKASKEEIKEVVVKKILRLPAEHDNMLKALAKSGNRSENSTIKQLIEDAYNQPKKKK